MFKIIKYHHPIVFNYSTFVETYLKVNRKKIVYFIIFLTLLGLGYCAYMIGLMYQEHSVPSYSLAYYSGKGKSDQNYSVPDFSFVDQNNQTVTLNNFKNKIWVTDFFFTTCQGICPVMETNMKQVLDSFRNDQNVKFLSHTVQPEYDSVKVLKEFASKYGNIDHQWYFVTGEKQKLYNQARFAYFIAEPTKLSIQEDFVHSQLFALIDQRGRIRGYYDGTDSAEILKLISDIKFLNQ